MADTFDVVTLADGIVDDVVFDFNDMAGCAIVADSLQITAPAKQQAMVESGRRYAGARQVGEAHGNAQFAALILVKGTSVDEALGRVAAALAVLERDPRDLYLRWTPDGATSEVYSEIRSTGQWAVAPRWAQLTGAHSTTIQVGWQVAPLAQGAPITMGQWRGDLPAVIQLDETIPGNAPALADVTITTGDGTGVPPIWALLGWTPRPAVGLAAAPFGLLEGEAAGDLSGWRVDRTTVGNTTGDACIRDTAASSAKAYTASWEIDPTLLAPDEFSGEVDVEVWARIILSNALVSPTLTLSARPADGIAFGQPRWSHEWGRLGRPLVPPTIALLTRTRLGTVTLAVDRARPRPWKIWIDGALGAGSSDQWGIDHLVLVPARSRAVSRSGVPLDDAYPRFVASTAATRKTIHHDLSAHVSRPGVHGHPDHGLGGSLLEMPTGDVDLAVVLSSHVPDSPVPQTAGEQLAHPATVDVTVTPRWHLIAGA